MRRVIVNICIVRVATFPLYLTTDEIKLRVLEKITAINSEPDTSISVGIVELPAEPPPQPTGE